MKVLPNPATGHVDEVPMIAATPVVSRRDDNLRPEVVALRPVVSAGESAANIFLRQFRVLLGAARLYERNHPRLMEILASAEQQLRIVLAQQSPLDRKSVV
jgi:hypothetical protein